MTRVGVYNEDGEPLGFEDVYEPDPADYQDQLDELADRYYLRDEYGDEDGDR